ncbi:hypothetical protein FA95DRAFT_1578386 [Auriscalpium vulgare]|uniref:Uncharacterized protein n=1 Tax=Auriscalpium vulgare TaxID=40419 RepID=A0ACB8R1Z1_9AGAM|nr:hypothetical protein FA95DRAFT_1578386 [Auriscalpium vulgare]
MSSMQPPYPTNVDPVEGNGTATVVDAHQTWQGRMARLQEARGDNACVLPGLGRNPNPRIWHRNMLVYKAEVGINNRRPVIVYYHGRVSAINIVDEFYMPLGEVSVSVEPSDSHIRFSAEHMLFEASRIGEYRIGPMYPNASKTITAVRLCNDLHANAIRVKPFTKVYDAIGTSWPEGPAKSLAADGINIGDIVMVKARIERRFYGSVGQNSGYAVFKLLSLYRLAYWSHNRLIDN